MAVKHLVLLGGGHAHVEVLRQLGSQRRQPQPAPPPPPPLSPPRQPTPHGASSECDPAVGASASAAPPAAAEPQRRVPPQPQPPAPAPPRVTVVSRGRFTPYSGMLPGWVAGHYSYDQCHVDLAKLASYAGAELLQAEATGLDAHARHVLFGDGSPPLPYDVLSIDIGITPGRASVPGAGDAEGAVTPVKPIDRFASRYERLVERYRAAAAAAAAQLPGPATEEAGASEAAGGLPPKALMRVVVVGGGAGGVELAAAVRYRLEAERRACGWPEGCGRVAVSLVCRGGLLPGHPPHVRRLVGRLLGERGVEVVGEEAVSVSPGELRLASGARLPYDECLWCTAASPAAWLRQSGLPTDSQGFILINEQLQSEGGPQEVFAAGDVASCAAHPRPKAGVYAVRQGPPLAANLVAFLQGRPLAPFRPQATALALISLGDRFCVASRTGAAPPPVGAKAPAAGGAAAVSAFGGGGTGGGGCGDGAGGGCDGPGWLLNGCGGAASRLSGPLLWRWKDSIDRAFMRRYGEDLDS